MLAHIPMNMFVYVVTMHLLKYCLKLFLCKVSCFFPKEYDCFCRQNLKGKNNNNKTTVVFTNCAVTCNVCAWWVAGYMANMHRDGVEVLIAHCPDYSSLLHARRYHLMPSISLIVFHETFLCGVDTFTHVYTILL